MLTALAAPPDTARASVPAIAPESAPGPLLVPGRAMFRDTTDQDPKARARREYEHGLELERTNVPAGAIICYQRAARLDTMLAGPQYRTGLLYQRAGALRKAAGAFAAELHRHPDDPDALRQLGLALSQMDQHAPAISRLEALVRRLPGDGENWRALGYAYMRAGRPKDAETATRRAVALSPASALAHRDLAYVLAATQRESEARAEYRRAVELDPKETGAWVNLANLDRANGDPDGALANLREAEKRDSTLALAIRGQAQVLAEQQRFTEAGETYRRLLARAPSDLDARFAAVQVYEGLDRDDIALALARDGVRLEPYSGPARLLLGMALEAQRRLREAALELRRAEAWSPDSTGRRRARALIATLQAEAPDSLRARFSADSVALAQDLARDAARRAAPQAGPRGLQLRAVTAPADSQRTGPVKVVPPADTLLAPRPPDTR